MLKEVVFLDIRIEKSERAIKKAFMELRAHKPLEKIRVKDLCDLAQINKSTFYSHYEDIFALSSAMETALIERVMAALPRVLGDDGSICADTLTRQLFHAFAENQREVDILFSGARRGLFVNGIEEALRRRVTQERPDYWSEPLRGILLSFCVQGGYYAFANNSASFDEESLVRALASIASAAQTIYLSK